MSQPLSENLNGQQHDLRISLEAGLMLAVGTTDEVVWMSGRLQPPCSLRLSCMVTATCGIRTLTSYITNLILLVLWSHSEAGQEVSVWLDKNLGFTRKNVNTNAQNKSVNY